MYNTQCQSCSTEDSDMQTSTGASNNGLSSDQVTENDNNMTETTRRRKFSKL